MEENNQINARILNQQMGDNVETIKKQLQIDSESSQITSESSFPHKSKSQAEIQEQQGETNQEIRSQQEDDAYLEIQQDLRIKTSIMRECPYVSTIKRYFLDFDFEKLCSISLMNLNVYACLVCGQYYQGRGKNTHAYTHSLQNDHHIFINLQNGRVYCLPDNYQVLDVSFKDIQYNLSPTYDKEGLKELDDKPQYRRALTGKEYLPGFVGLNNLKCTDYVNVVIQALTRVKPFRDFLIFFQENHRVNDYDFKTILVKTFAQLMRKIWNPRNFKGHVSPHEFLQAISLQSGKRFQIDHQCDASPLLSWLLDTLESELKGIKNCQNIIADCFRGEVEVYSFKPLQNQTGFESIPTIETKPFNLLTLNMPQASLYVEDNQKLSIPHESIFNLLKKFDGVTTQDDPSSRKTFRIKKLPKYLIIVMKRFSSNNFFIEQNPTIVSFPIKDLDMKQYLDISSVGETNTKYNLVANICHEGKFKDGFYKIHVKNDAQNQLYEIQDLHITPIMPQLVCVSESYIQIYEQLNAQN